MSVRFTHLMEVVCSFLWLSGAPLYGCTTLHVSLVLLTHTGLFPVGDFYGHPYKAFM